ncbi:MAG: extracellular solute-binding protein [Pseudomonadota bacterium]
MPIDRRQILAGITAAATGWVVPRGATAADLGDRIVERARVLAARGDAALTVLHPEGSEANLKPVVAAFTDATGVAVRLIPAPADDVNSRLMLAAMSDEAFDLALPATFAVPDLVEAGALQPLDGFQRAMGGDDTSRSLYTLGDYYNDKLYGFQTDGDVYVMFYNTKLLHDPEFARAHEAEYGSRPAPAKTWEELDRMLALYHRPEQGRFGGALYRTPDYVCWEWWIRLHAKGVLPFDPNMRPRIVEPGAVLALEELVAASRFLTPNANSAGLWENWDTFARGNVLCSIGWGGSQKYFRQQSAEFANNVVAALTPGGDGNAFSYFNWGWNFSVPGNSRHPELAYLLARYAVEAVPSTIAVRETGGFFDPFLAQHYNDQKIRSLYGEQFLAVHKTSMEKAIPDLYLRGRTLYMRTLSDNLLAVDRREITPREALNSVARRWENITDALGRTEQVRQWRLLLRRYPPGFT